MTYKPQIPKDTKKVKNWSVIIIVISIIVIAVAMLLLTQEVKTTPQQTISGGGILATPINYHDFGEVSLRGGVISTEVPLVNIGEGVLTITFMNTSCGCTSAQIINQGKIGPIFGMASHGKSPTDWRTTIEPGEKASLRVYYDPGVHPNFKGTATREISIISDSKNNGIQTIRIKVNQVD